MRMDIIRSAILIVASTVLLGFVYPPVMVAVGQIAFSHAGQRQPDQARTAGRSAPSWPPRPSPARATSTRAPRPRPAYNADGTTLLQPGPEQQGAGQQLVNSASRSVLKLEGPYNPGLTAKDIPVDAVTTSGSGIDPDISKAYADLQAPRIAAVRHLPLAAVHDLIDSTRDGRSLGFFGEPGVNVLELNLALDREH